MSVRGIIKIFAVLFLALILVWIPGRSMASEYLDQSDDYASSLVTHSGGYVYDWQLANMIKMWIGDAGFANMIFIFNQCYSGGMIDDLKDKLSGDVALMSASRHTETAIMLGDGFTATDKSRGYGYERPESYFAKEVSDELARTGADAPTAKQIADNAAAQDPGREGGHYMSGNPRPANKSEHPQYTSSGNGDNIKIGKKADGSDVASKHAILFVGDAGAIADWNDGDRAYKALVDKQGLSADNVTVLMGGGPGTKKPNNTNVPDYVDGKGTKKDLFDAIKAMKDKMNENEQFILWVSDHGNRERTATALNKAINDPVKQTVPPPTTTASDPNMWDLDTKFIADLLADPTNNPYISLIIDSNNISTPYLFPEYLTVYLNNYALHVDYYDPNDARIYAMNDDPDLDGYEFIFPIPDECWLSTENLIQIDWEGSQFWPYTISALQISTGKISRSSDPVIQIETKPVSVWPPYGFYQGTYYFRSLDWPDYQWSYQQSSFTNWTFSRLQDSWWQNTQWNIYHYPNHTQWISYIDWPFQQWRLVPWSNFIAWPYYNPWPMTQWWELPWQSFQLDMPYTIIPGAPVTPTGPGGPSGPSGTMTPQEEFCYWITQTCPEPVEDCMHSLEGAGLEPSQAAINCAKNAAQRNDCPGGSGCCDCWSEVF